MSHSAVPIVETLEDRIAPASASFVDIDGDIVKVTTTKGTNAELQALVDDAVGGNSGTASQMQTLDLTPAFAGSGVKIAVSAKGAAGDGMVSVWNIDAAGMDLASVEVKGDLSKLTAGDANYANGSVKTIKVQSIGVDPGAMAKDWFLLGGTATLQVAGDVTGASLSWNNPADAGKLVVNKITIGGDLIGGATDFTGVIALSVGMDGTAELKEFAVGGNLQSTDYLATGSVIVGDLTTMTGFIGKLGKVTIGGSLVGDNNKDATGLLFANTSIGKTTVAGDLIGGGGYSGAIIAPLLVGDVNVGGSLQGGNGFASGSVVGISGIQKTVTVGGFAQGGNGAYSGSIASENGSIANVKIGSYLSGGSATKAGSVYGETGVGSVWIGGSLLGGDSSLAGCIAVNDGGNFSMGDITIKGSLVAGSVSSTGSIIGDKIRKISIGGSMIGGAQEGTAAVFASISFDSLFVGGGVDGGAGAFSASIRSLGDDAKASFIKIGGSIFGGSGANSGAVLVNGSLGRFSVGQDIFGGTGNKSASVIVDDDASSLYVGGDIIGNSVAGNSSAHLDFRNVGSVLIGGTITGGAGESSGHLDIRDAATITIGGGLAGGSGDFSGSVGFRHTKSVNLGIAETTGASISGGSGVFAGCLGGLSVVSAWIAGDVLGGSNLNTGKVIVAGGGSVFIGGDVRGGFSQNSGGVEIGADLKKLTIAGDLVGSDDVSDTGSIYSGLIGLLEIKGNIVGGDTSMASVTRSGYIYGSMAGSIVIGGDIQGGQAFNPTSNFDLGAIRLETIGSLLVKGDILGNSSQYVTISATGHTNSSKTANLAIKSLTVLGDVHYANILGGYSPSGNTLNGNGGADGSAQLGEITVDGDFMNSSIIAGANSKNSNPNHWADGGNTLLPKLNPDIPSSIAKIVIKGASFANVQNGFVAQQIKSLNLGGFEVPIPAGNAHFQVSGGNFYVQQIAA